MLGSTLSLTLFALALVGPSTPQLGLSLEEVEVAAPVGRLDAASSVAMSRSWALFALCRPCPKFGVSDLNQVPETVVRLVGRGVVVDARAGDHPAISIRLRPRGAGARLRLRVRF